MSGFLSNASDGFDLKSFTLGHDKARRRVSFSAVGTNAAGDTMTVTLDMPADMADDLGDSLAYHAAKAQPGDPVPYDPAALVGGEDTKK